MATDGRPTASIGDMEQPRAQCDGCGHDLDERESPVVYDCFHALHAACTYGSDDACPLPYCLAPRTRPAAPEVGGGGAPSSPPDSSLAGQMRDDGPSAGAATECDVCGGHFWTDECPQCMLSPPWSSSLGGCFGSPSPPPPSPSLVGQFEQPPPATAGPAAPPQPAHTGPFEQPPANQFGPPPPYFDYYYTGMFQQPSPAVPYAFVSPRPPQTGQFAWCPAPSPPSHAVAPFQQPPPPSHYPLQTSTFEYHQQQQPPAPARFAYAPAAAVGSPSSCAACGGAVVRGQTTVTSQCNHTFHFRCFAGSAYACPACGAQWSDVGPVPQPPPYRY